MAAYIRVNLEAEFVGQSEDVGLGGTGSGEPFHRAKNEDAGKPAHVGNRGGPRGELRSRAHPYTPEKNSLKHARPPARTAETTKPPQWGPCWREPGPCQALAVGALRGPALPFLATGGAG